MTSAPSGPRRDVTVNDVARFAEVSRATAARALGDYGAVSPGVRDRVLTAAAELGYRPNALARSMKTGRSNTIGAVVGDIENPFFGRAVRGLSDVARAAGFDVILANSGEDPAAERAAVEVLLDKRVDGLVVAPASSVETEHLRQVAASGHPMVLLDRRADGVDVDSVASNHRDAAVQVAQHLVDAGHRAFAHLTSMAVGTDTYDGRTVLPLSSAGDRIAGVLEVLTRAGVDRPERFVHLGVDGSGGAEERTRALLAAPDAPTAVITSDSLVGLGALRAIRGLGLRIPDDVSLVTFDDSEWTSITTPPLTVVSQEVYELGAEAGRVLLARMDKRRAPAVTRVFEAGLVVRGSVGAPRG